MISGGNATVYVSNMDNAIRFYTEVLGLKLTNRFGNHWATVQAGKTLFRLALSCPGTNRLESSRRASANRASK
jgi:catechol 2,3-dioxygenase-like lactoylglutathione lyase family enzyme